MSSDESYATGDKYMPVQDDDRPVESGIDEATADTDAQLKRDEEDAIDKSNIIEERTRHAKPVAGSYREPGDEEGMPAAE